MKNNIVIFLTRCYFFDAISVNQLFLEDRVKKNNDVVIFLHRLKLDDAKFWDRVKKMHHPSVNRFDGLILWYVFDYQNKNGDDTTKL